MQNLISRTGKIHARLASVSTWYLCQSGARFGGPVSAGTTDNPVTCQRCRAILAYRGSVDSPTTPPKPPPPPRPPRRPGPGWTSPTRQE